MELNINNTTVAEQVGLCLDEFYKIKSIINGIGSMSHPVPYLTRYSIIRACGIIEFGFKTIISDINSNGQSNQVKQFIDKKFRNSSMNPSYANICKSLAEFDSDWQQRFKDSINNLEHKSRILASLQSLNEARNSFAHGGTPSTSFSSLESYFKDSLIVLECIEKTI